MKARRKIIVGLGNPGKEYADTYHNVGARAVRAFAAGLAFKAHKRLFTYAAADGAVFVLPLTFMNESGAAVRAAMKKFNAAPKDIIVVHDESDLPLGAYRVSTNRNAAGHRGVQSIIDALRTKNFARIRIGIHPPAPAAAGSGARRAKAGTFVLAHMNAGDQAVIDGVTEKIAEIVPVAAPTGSS